jgi:hypothetical protein
VVVTTSVTSATPPRGARGARRRRRTPCSRRSDPRSPTRLRRTSIDDIAAAAGIGRRTFFRYFPSKADLVWGDFEAELVRMRACLARLDPRCR